MNITAIVQARCGSSRFPNKIFADICGKPLIYHVINRLRFSETINEIVLATTTNSLDDALETWAKNNSVNVFRGSENDVLCRYYDAGTKAKADIIVRITADDPFKEPSVIDKAVRKLIDDHLDFVCNNNPPSFPEGLDVEVFTKKSLSIAQERSNDHFEREHVTQYFYRHPSDFKMTNITNLKDLSHLRWTIDTEKDLEMVKKIYSMLYKSDSEIFYFEEILDLLNRYPEIAAINANVTRSEMYKSSK